MNPCPTCPSGFVYLTSNGTSLRNAGQVQLRRRLRNGFTASGQYTLAKATDNATAFGGASLSGSAVAQDWLDLDAEQAPSNFDQRHQFTAQAQYTTGAGITGGTLVDGLKGRLLKDWTFVTQFTIGSGTPLTPVYLVPVPGTGFVGSVRGAPGGRRRTTCPTGYYLNPLAYTAPAAGEWGSAGRNSATGPRQFLLNAAVGRTFRWGERFNIDWRLDATQRAQPGHLHQRQHHRRQRAVRAAEPGRPDAQDPKQPAGEVLIMRRASRFVVAAAALVAALVPLRAQQQPAPPAEQPIFRSSTRLIVQTVTVKDKDGRPIEGLTAKDFVITEDGQPQDIAFVEFQRLATEAAPAPRRRRPPRRARARPAPPVAPVTQPQFAPPVAGDSKYRDRRLLILYFDMSAMPPGDQLRAFQSAIKYVSSQMTASDLMAIMTYEGGSVRIKQDFTADRAVIRNVIDVLIYGEDKDGDGVRDEPDQSSAFGQGDAEFNIFNTDRQLAALQTAVTMLRPFPEQKALIYFGSGLRLNGTDNTAQLRATTNAAVRANVTINPVDARGLVALAPLGDATQRSPGGLAMFTGQMAMNVDERVPALAGHALLARQGHRRHGDVRQQRPVRRHRAGRAGDDQLLHHRLLQHASGQRRQVPPHPGDAGQRRAKAQLTYRQGYFADKEWARLNGVERERQLEEALMLENPVTDITIAMEVNYFQLNRAEYFVPVAVKIPGSELALARRRGAQRTLLDFIGEVKDNYGITIQNVRDKLDIKISDQTATELSARPIQYETGFTLLPGQYVIKFLARDAEAGPSGHLSDLVHDSQL